MFNREYITPLEPGNQSGWAYHVGCLTDAECDDIIRLGTMIPAVQGYLGGVNDVDATIRQSGVGFFTKSADTEWVFNRVRDLAKTFNAQFWNFDLKFLECLQFTIYNSQGDFYTRHVDMRYQALEVRKLSMSIQLSDPDSYQGGDLRLFRVGDQYDAAPRQRGTVVAFPSYMAHEVTPVTHGTRYSLVSWVVGPPFR